ncbi:DivIVA domain-containing protein [candidate division WOR-3 bacterium]|nr:DivIVA domain-containing protein [candidate division WOR-3 bacterium]
MGITPLEIRKMEFRKTFRGLDVQEVQSFLEIVADQLESLNRENMSIKEQLRNLEQRLEDYKSMESTLQNTLTSAQKSSEQIRKNAEQEAELIIQNAKLQGETIVERARSQVVEITSEISALNTHRVSIKAQIKSFLEAQLKAIESGEIRYKKVEIDDAFPHIKRKIKTNVPSLDNLFEQKNI